MSEISKQKQSQEQQDSIMPTTNAWSYILPNIFKYLEMKDLLRASHVCTMWREAAAHPSLWKTVRQTLTLITFSDWEGLTNILQKRGTQELDLRRMPFSLNWILKDEEKVIIAISRITTLVNLKLQESLFQTVESFSNKCPQLKALSATAIESDTIHNLECIGNLKQCQKLRIRTIHDFPCSPYSIDLPLSPCSIAFTPLQELIHLKQLSLSLFDDRGNSINVIQTLTKLETLELGLYTYPENFGTNVLLKLKQLKRLRLEMFIPTSDTLKSISKLENLSHLELVYLQLNNDFKYLAYCKNIKRLLIIFRDRIKKTKVPKILKSVEKLWITLTHFVIGVPTNTYNSEIVCDFTGKQVNQNSEEVVKISRIYGEGSFYEYDLYPPDSEEYMNEEFLQKDCLLELQNTLPTTRVIVIHIRYLHPEYLRTTLMPIVVF